MSDVNLKFNLDEDEKRCCSNLCRIIVDISDDYYKAYITVKRENEEANITKEDIYKALEEKKVVYGIDHNLIESIVRSPDIADKIVIAQGEKHKNGKDGRIIFNIDTTDSLKPQMLPNGKVNYKNLHFVKQVSKGDILARKINPTRGENGITVTGRTIKAKHGKDIKFKAGKNVSISNDGTLLIADIDGIVKIIDEKINVIEVLEINKDVGVSTGNISFSGKVIVKGNVQQGYTIKSNDDIEIYGIVEGAEIISMESVIIHKGIHNSSKVYAEKDVKSCFVENSKIEAKGDVTCDYVMHSNILCNGKMHVNKKKGIVVGGFIKARKGVNAKVIGSNIGTITKVEVGIDEELLNEYKSIKDRIKSIEENIKKLNKIIEILEVQNELSEHSKEELQKTLSTRDKYIDEMNNLQDKLDYLNLTIRELKDSKVQAKIVYPGVKLKINNSYHNVRDVLENVTFMKENGEIRFFHY
ncbi:DUF342 domain-containing protein [Caminicella sporogenes]|uniref:DUF342 domain-containing protein n=1 Tax=Caminicella sporogenes TaxID=166485 RepID=UPI00254221F5|nr:FapA family protein [Caminicella sporogenes]WIF94664.1 FapA family protein [Caminicella sporogenes]